MHSLSCLRLLFPGGGGRTFDLSERASPECSCGGEDRRTVSSRVLFTADGQLGTGAFLEPVWWTVDGGRLVGREQRRSPLRAARGGGSRVGSGLTDDFILLVWEYSPVSSGV